MMAPHIAYGFMEVAPETKGGDAGCCQYHCIVHSAKTMLFVPNSI
ncbi:hypothetical protein R9C00_05195 [Flammeovirgaceae bacterium SG7u.111]|nr:hypothetical protein [Flammeovirgaceae bacterium SG7u.132]WPO36841.1 hypothetical protein R9C00_05195 [Flammeovirgaceae bacterium SG7u.111]